MNADVLPDVEAVTTSKSVPRPLVTPSVNGCLGGKLPRSSVGIRVPTWRRLKPLPLCLRPALHSLIAGVEVLYMQMTRPVGFIHCQELLEVHDRGAAQSAILHTLVCC